MAKGLKRRDIIIVAVVILLAMGAAGYFLIFKDNGRDNDNGDGDDTSNRRPIADAGLDIVKFSGDEVFLNGSGSYDPDDDDLLYYWDTDSGVDSNSDGITDNDRDIVGKEVTTIYPFTQEDITYIVTLNVSDGALFHTDTLRVTILPDTSQEAPEITMGCRYQGAIPYLDAHFIVTIEAVSYPEIISNFTYMIEDKDGEKIMNGTLSELIVQPPNATIRLIDGPEVGRLSVNDMFYIKEEGDISEGCMLILYYGLLRDPVGEVELVKS